MVFLSQVVNCLVRQCDGSVIKALDLDPRGQLCYKTNNTTLSCNCISSLSITWTYFSALQDSYILGYSYKKPLEVFM